MSCRVLRSRSLTSCQANFRRTNVATKMKITYLREQYLNVKMQYKACESIPCPCKIMHV